MSKKVEATTSLCVEQCGSRCCRTSHMVLHLHEPEALRMLALAKKKGIPLEESDFVQHRNWDKGPTLKMGKMGRCRFLQHSTGLCRIYAARPGACRQFPHEPWPGCLVWPAEEDDSTHRPLAPGVPREVRA